MKIPFSKKEIVVREVEVKDEAELTEEEKEELKLKKAKKGLVGKIVLTGASFAAGVGAGVAGYKKYKEDNESSKYGTIEIHTDSPEVADAAFSAAIATDDDETED